MLEKWDEEKLEFTPTNSKQVLYTQLSIMESYLHILEERAIKESINLDIKVNFNVCNIEEQ